MNNKQGGKRSNAGAKLKYGEPTVVLSCRCPISQVPYIKSVIEEELAKFRVR